MKHRILEAIDVLSRFPAGLTVTELASHLDMNKSSSSRLLASLLESGVVAFDAPARRYTPCLQVSPVLSPALEQLRELGLSPLAHAVRQFPEMSLHLGFNRGMDSLFFLGVQLVEDVVLARFETFVSPANATAAGKMLLALLPGEELDALLQSPLKAMSDGTITDPGDLRADLQRTLSTGLAVNDRETAERGYSIAAPIRDSSGRAIAALGAALHYWSGDDAASREFRQRARPIVVDLASRLSRFMGYADVARTVVA